MTLAHKPEEYKLSNGIPVIFQHLDGHVGTFHWWNLTGSTDESGPEAGFAHFLEHMLFKDAGAKETGNASSGQTARLIESLGGEINAYTTFDQTVYHVTCSEQYWEKVIDHFGVMAAPQRFLPEDFEREREVILEELRRGQDSPDRQLYEDLFGLTYKKHPYGRPVIGYEKILKQAKVRDLERYYRKHYVSSRMGLVLVGPIADEKGERKKRLLRVLEKRFGKRVIPERKAAPRALPAEKPLQGLRTKARHFDIQTPELAISFRIPELTHADAPLLEVLSGILGTGESSRLYRRLFYDRSLVTDISASVYIPKDPGMFLISAELKETGDLDQVLGEIVSEIRKVIEDGVDQEEIDRVIALIESEKLYATQTVDGLAGRIGLLRFSLGDLRFDTEYLDQIKSVNASTLKRLAREYLTPERMSLVLFQPEAETLLKLSQVEKIIAPLQSAPAPVRAKASKTKSGEPEILTTPSGLKVAYLERPGTPVFSIYAAAYGGSRSEIGLGDQYWGASHLISQTWAKGTPEIDSRKLSALIEGCAASLDGFSGRNTIGLQSTGLIRDWDRLSTLFSDVFFNPAFSEDELAHAKRVTLDMIRSIPNHSSQVCSRLFMENLFGDHPYARSPIGTEEQVERIGSTDLHHLHQTFIHPGNLSLAVVGGVSRHAFEEWLGRFDETLSKQKSRFVQDRLPAPATLPAPRWASSRFDREQAHILIGGIGLSMFDSDRHALRILQNILGGQSGRLFIELREKRSMAYSVAPTSMEGIETGYVGTYIACAPGKKDEAIAEIRKVIETLVKKGPSAAELERAKNYFLGQQAMNLQSTWSLAAGYGLELLYRGSIISDSEVKKRILSVTSNQVRAIAKRLLLDAPQLTVVVS